MLSLESRGDFNLRSFTLCISEFLFVYLFKECQSSLGACVREFLSSFSIVRNRGFFISLPDVMLSTSWIFYYDNLTQCR